MRQTTFGVLWMSASFHGCELKRDKSHICGLWMLIAAALRYVRGAVERLEWGRRGDRASLGRSARFQRCCKNTHLSAWKGSAVFYQNITSPKPSSSPGAHGTRGYLTTSAEVHCKGISVVLNPARSLCWTSQASLGALLGLKASFSLSTNDPLDFVWALQTVPSAAGMLPGTLGDINGAVVSPSL